MDRLNCNYPEIKVGFTISVIHAKVYDIARGRSRLVAGSASALGLSGPGIEHTGTGLYS